jgi:hypothetical protein
LASGKASCTPMFRVKWVPNREQSRLNLNQAREPLWSGH